MPLCLLGRLRVKLYKRLNASHTDRLISSRDCHSNASVALALSTYRRKHQRRPAACRTDRIYWKPRWSTHRHADYRRSGTRRERRGVAMQRHRGLLPNLLRAHGYQLLFLPCNVNCCQINKSINQSFICSQQHTKHVQCTMQCRTGHKGMKHLQDGRRHICMSASLRLLLSRRLSLRPVVLV